MARPRLLDLFCGAGGAAMGYHRAGFDVVGVDIKPQPRYPFEFHQADAMTYPLEGFDAIHASPPCQAYFRDKRALPQWGPHNHPRLIEPIRERLRASALPFVIENVPGAPLISPVVVCGSALGLAAEGRELRRHRLFESNVMMLRPACAHGVYGTTATIVGHHSGESGRWHRVNTPLARVLMGMPWATWKEMAEAIPPAYTEFIGAQLVRAVSERAA